MAAGVAGAMAATLEPILEVVGPDGSRYLVMREHASKFATVHGVIRPDNFTRAMKPEKLQFYGKIIEGWQAAEHVRFVEQQDKVTGDVVDFRFISATAHHDMEEFYNKHTAEIQTYVSSQVGPVVEEVAELGSVAVPACHVSHAREGRDTVLSLRACRSSTVATRVR